MYEIIFYVFSFLLAYLDFKKYIVPNSILLTLLIMLIIFGLLESRLNINSFFIAFALFSFFSALILINKKMILGGGDIKYIMLVSIFLEPILFPFFLIITGVVQSLFLIFTQLICKKEKTAMVPAMLVSVLMSQWLYTSNYFPLLWK
ncbi:MAG: prepilin peptidase [Campylobacteraceae bacterium]|nr:prepilin peptidase [Campylobacteraceae bacterium]